MKVRVRPPTFPNTSEPNRRNRNRVQPHDPNSTLAIQARDCPMDLNQFYQHAYGYPQLLGMEDQRPMPRGSLFDLQDRHAQQLQTNDARIAVELWGVGPRVRRVIRDDVSHENRLLPTHNSDWFQQMNEKKYLQTGKGRTMVNVPRLIEY